MRDGSGFQMLGVGLNVTDLERSLDFYTRLLRMQEVQRYEFDGMTEVVLRWSDDPTDPGIVLVAHATRDEALVIGNGFSRVMAFVPDVVTLFKELAAEGFETSEPTAIDAAPATIGFTKDPDGYPIELIEVR